MEYHETLAPTVRVISVRTLLALAAYIEVEIEVVYNMYRMRRLLSLGHPNYAIHETCKSGLDR
jgi:hypothetical protein